VPHGDIVRGSVSPDEPTPDLILVMHVGPERVGQLLELYRSAWWAADRTAEDVRAMLAGSDLVFAVVDRRVDRLVGFARVLTDEVYLALLLDVIVAPNARGSGLGRVVLDAVVSHPRLAGVRSLELVCQPELVPFYRLWGFTDEVGGSRLLRRPAR
jgi:GNAT superfamily N-acetyltransferase